MEIVVNYGAVLIAALMSMLVGSLWYSQAGFGGAWARLAKVNMNKRVGKNDLVWLLGGAFVAALITAFVVASMSFLAHQYFANSFLVDALVVACVLWLGLIAARFYTHDLFEGRPPRLTLLNVFHELVTLMVIALVIGLMGY